MINGIIILAIIVAIALGYKTKINTGFFGMAFAYLIGTFMLGLKPAEIIKMWPVSIFFVILAISLFYNFAMANGTLENLSQHMLYHTRKFPRLLPIAIFMAATIIAALGAGFFAVMAFFAPITVILCRKTGLNPLIGALAVNYGALCGNNFMVSPGGVVFIGLMNQAGYESTSYTNEIGVFLASFIIPLIVLSIMILLTKQHTGHVVEITKPEPFDKVQSRTLALIFSMVGIVLVFPLLYMVFPKVALLKFMNSAVDIGLIAILFTILGLFLHIGNEKDIVKNVPWGTIIMICGVGMLISVAIKAGTVQMISSFVSSSIPVPLVPVVMAVIGGFMSFFSSTMGVVTPALFPLVPGLESATGIPSVILFSCIVIGAQATAISPFSSGGSLMLSAVGDEERESMFNQLMFKGAPICLVAAILYSILMYLFFA